MPSELTPSSGVSATTLRGELNLARWANGTYVLRINGQKVMSDMNQGRTEQALATLAAAQLDRLPRRILVGGLGFGYTLRAALALDGVERVTVVELEPQVVAWHREHFGTEPLDDLRTDLVIADLVEFLGDAPSGGYDMVAIDIDNGPELLIHAANAPLWSLAGIEVAARALAPGGVLAYWTCRPSPPFEELLRLRFEQVHVHQDGTETVYLAH